MRRSTLATALVAVFISYLGTPAAVKAGGYVETDLVADVNPLIDQNGIEHKATIVDPLLVNPWGIAESPTSPFWVSDNGKGVATLYVVNSTTPIAKNQNLMFVNIPAPGGSSPRNNDGRPTGAAFNTTTLLPSTDPNQNGFQITGFSADGQTKVTAPAVFLFATEDGTIVGWNPGVFPDNSGGQSPSTFGIITPVDNSKVGAVYKGLAMATDTHGNTFLYAANFASGMVERYDRNFHLVGSFTDPHLGEAFHPFNVAFIGGKLFVTFAVRNPHTGDNVPGKGSGAVDVFNIDGTLNQRFAFGGHLKAPWGMAHVPSSNFGPLADRLWIGNFGDGHINAFDPASGAFIDQVRDSSGKPLVIDGLWALQVGNGGNGGLANTVYFTAGPNDEKDGLFGSLTPN
jgi:uncharacterized protein (TIGR03118 family)